MIGNTRTAYTAISDHEGRGNTLFTQDLPQPGDTPIRTDDACR